MQLQSMKCQGTNQFLYAKIMFTLHKRANNYLFPRLDFGTTYFAVANNSNSAVVDIISFNICNLTCYSDQGRIRIPIVLRMKAKTWSCIVVVIQQKWYPMCTGTSTEQTKLSFSVNCPRVNKTRLVAAGTKFNMALIF